MLRFGFYSFVFGVILLVPLCADDPNVALGLPGQIARAGEVGFYFVEIQATENSELFSGFANVNGDSAGQVQGVFVGQDRFVSRAQDLGGVDQAALLI